MAGSGGETTQARPCSSSSRLRSRTLLRLIIQRILQFVPVLLVSTVLVFTVVRLAPGDPATAQFGPRASDARYADAVQLYREQLGLNRPIVVQYFLWLKQVARGNFGDSIRSGQPVIAVVLEKLPATLELTFAGILFGLVFGVPLGIVAALKRGSLLDTCAMVISVIGLAIPGFWLGMLLDKPSAAAGWLAVLRA